MTDAEKLELRYAVYRAIDAAFHTVLPELREIGLLTYQLPVFDEKITLRRLETVRQALDTFVAGDAVRIFRAARDLRPPGVLQAWADDELTRSARETLVYTAARRLLRETWFSFPSLKSFFKQREQKDGNEIPVE